MCQWVQILTPDILPKETEQVVHLWIKCLSQFGDYVEKRHLYVTLCFEGHCTKAINTL